MIHTFKEHGEKEVSLKEKGKHREGNTGQYEIYRNKK